MRVLLSSVGLAALLTVSSGCGGGADGDRVEQRKVTMVVTNHLDHPRYVDWNDLGQGSISCEFERNGNWEPCRFAPPGCKDPCLEENRLDSCCKYCVSTPKVRVIDPGESIHIVWDGKLYSVDDNHCSECSCFRDEDPRAGNYTAEICVYDSFTCEWDPCSGPDAEGIIDVASPSGSSSCHGVEFSVDYGEDTLTIPVE